MGQCCSSPAARRDRCVAWESEVARTELSTLGKHEKPNFGVEDMYNVISLLGSGGTGQTWLATEKGTGKKVAIKFIRRPLPKVLLPMVTSEVQIQSRICEGHVSLVWLEHALLSRTHLALVMEYAAGGNLTNYIMSRHATRDARQGLYLSEPEANFIFRQFMGAVEYLHTHNIAHRDLKLDNIVLESAAEPPRIKLIDFGFAKDWEAEDNMLTSIGTPVYMSPQQICCRKDHKPYSGMASDIWASGVMLFVMLLGVFPFDHEGHPDPNTSGAQGEVLQEQQAHTWREAPRVAALTNKLSATCCDLLDKMLERDQSKRICMEGIRAHPWFNLPLNDWYTSVLDDLGHKQAHLSLLVRAGAGKLTDRDTAIDALILEAGRCHDQLHDHRLRRIPLASVGRTTTGSLLVSPSRERAAQQSLSRLPSSAAAGTSVGALGTSVMDSNGPSAAQLAAAAAATVAALKDASALNPSTETQPAGPLSVVAEEQVPRSTAAAAVAEGAAKIAVMDAAAGTTAVVAPAEAAAGPLHAAVQAAADLHDLADCSECSFAASEASAPCSFPIPSDLVAAGTVPSPTAGGCGAAALATAAASASSSAGCVAAAPMDSAPVVADAAVKLGPGSGIGVSEIEVEVVVGGPV